MNGATSHLQVFNKMGLVVRAMPKKKLARHHSLLFGIHNGEARTQWLWVTTMDGVLTAMPHDGRSAHEVRRAFHELGICVSYRPELPVEAFVWPKEEPEKALAA